MDKIISNWEDVLGEKDWERIYNEVRREVLNDLFNKKYSKMISKGIDDDEELDLIKGELE